MTIYQSQQVPSCPTYSLYSETMTNEELDSNTVSEQQILEWIGDSLPYLPSIFDDPYTSSDFNSDSWWLQGQTPDQERIYDSSASFNSNSNTTTASTSTTSTSTPVVEAIFPDSQLQSDSSKKRKTTDHDVTTPKTSQISRKNQNRRMTEAHEGHPSVEPQQPGVPGRKTAGSKRGVKSAAGNSPNQGNNRDGRWAEQLLNPCAAAISAPNAGRVQHLLCVINELASLTGDANHRLAAHGLRALTYQLSSPGTSSAFDGATTFASTNPKFFTDTLINFNDINPWFRIPNSIANSSILQILAEKDQPRDLHILDIGISHGIQWPTLLEELSRRSGGPPPLVRITVITQTIEDKQSMNTPFLVSAEGYNCSSQLLTFAKAMKINLQINRLENFPLQNLNPQVINSSPDETLIICAQFRLHNLNHNNPDDRTQFLRAMRNMKPKGVVLSENDMECTCNNCVDFATGFSRRVDYLWRFLDSTSVAYKGRESDERRMVEGEAAKALTNAGEMNEKKEKWCERMESVGFRKGVFGEDAIDRARALLRKYDSNWEISRVEEENNKEFGCVGLLWKGQTVSFSSLWKID